MLRKTTIISLVIVLVSVFTFTGCDSNTYQNLVNEAYQAEAELQEQQAKSGDIDLWKSTPTVRKLIKSTVTKDRLTAISFRLKSNDGSSIFIETPSFELEAINDDWRSLTASQTLNAIINDEQVKKAHQKGVSLEITGTILAWQEPSHNVLSINGTPYTPFAVCDIDNDGKWDFVTEGELYFTDDLNVMLSADDGQPLGIGHVTTNDSQLIPADDVTELKQLRKLTLQ